MSATLKLYGESLPADSIGSALYPSPALMADAIRASGAELVTLSLRRQTSGQGDGQGFWDHIRETGCRLCPIRPVVALRARPLRWLKWHVSCFETDWLKLEVIGDDYTLQPARPDWLKRQTA